MYNSIYVPVDNSEYSGQAIEQAVRFAKAFGAKITGSHVYAAKMHDYRFKQMEFTLPDEYLLEDEIERQRKIHDSLITMGLELISDSYLDVLARRCGEENLPVKRRMMDGKHHVEIVKDINTNGYDLTILGVLGVGKTRDSQIGSVCERVTRAAGKDVLVIKHVPKPNEAERDTILVGVDGSPQSFGGVRTAIELARTFNKKVELIGVYDPYLHYAVFNSIVDVLSEKAAKVFRFEEQNQLHEEIIDCGLAQIYQSHLNVAETISQSDDATVDIHKTLLDGKAFQKILARAREINPWLLIVGRIGVHSAKDEASLGSTTENLLRLCPCDILLSSRLEYPELDIRAEESILWTPEAEERMKRVPATVRGIARTGILRLALEQGHSVVTNAVIDEAMERFMPKYSAKATQMLAGTLVLEQAKQQPIAMCTKCGVTASNSNPARCAVCSGTEFNILTPEIIEKILSDEGGAEEESAFDGRKLRWSKEAREQLLAIEDKYQKRRAKARIEKVARMKKIDVVTVEFASAVIMDEIGKVLFDAPSGKINGETAPKTIEFSTHAAEDDEITIGIDDKGESLRSVFTWTDEAVAKLFTIPAGFMRDRTQRRAEALALESQIESIDNELLARAVEQGKTAMIDALVETGMLTPEQQSMLLDLKGKHAMKTNEPPASGPGGEAKCPFDALFSQDKEQRLTVQTGNGKSRPASNVYKGVVPQVLNEVGVMSDLARRRTEFKN